MRGGWSNAFHETYGYKPGQGDVIFYRFEGIIAISFEIGLRRKMH